VLCILTSLTRHGDAARGDPLGTLVASGHAFPLAFVYSLGAVDLHHVASQAVRHDVVPIAFLHATLLIVPRDALGPGRHRYCTMRILRLQRKIVPDPKHHAIIRRGEWTWIATHFTHHSWGPKPETDAMEQGRFSWIRIARGNSISCLYQPFFLPIRVSLRRCLDVNARVPINSSHNYYRISVQDATAQHTAQAMDWTTEFHSRQRQEFFPFATASRPVVETTQSFIQWVPGLFPQR